MGRSAFFVRLHGCPQHCPWCDSAGTWHPDWLPKEVIKMTEEEILADISGSSWSNEPDFIVVTGGEPAIFDLTEFTRQAHNVLRKVHLETSGAYEMKGSFDWVTVSPKDKWAKPCTAENIALASEFKLIIETPDDLPYWANRLTRIQYKGQPIWLHPEWSRREDPHLLKAMVEYVKCVGSPYRIGWQLHKLYQADRLDNRSVAPVPLGGNPALGF